MPAATAPRTYYEARHGSVPLRPPLAGGLASRTCIVGGGLAGLATALSLAERGEAPVLLEAARLGAGASGRNGGMASAGFARDTRALERLLGTASARALFRLSQDGLALLRERIARHAIPCDPVPGVVAASWFDAPAALQAEAERHNRLYGTRLELWPRRRLRELYRSPRYHDGLFDPDGFHLDPLALCHGYARAAEALGARIFEGSPVLALERREDGFRLRTPAGTLSAEQVVLCQSAYPPPLLPVLARATLPVMTYIIVTAPLGARAAEAIRAPHAVYDDRFATGYYRLLADGRLLWGGRVALGEAPQDLVPPMRRDLATVFPQLAGVEIEHAWSGRMGFARHRMPLIRALEPGLWTASLFGGHGLNTTTMAGELMARALLGDEAALRPFAPFAPVWAGGALGRLAARGLLRAHALKDALRAARGRGRGLPGAGIGAAGETPPA